MCGIAGIFHHKTSDSVNPKELIEIRDHMAARGPDGAGLWLSPAGDVGLAHRRLSIIDLNERANQPLASVDQKLQIVFNGEIYNYRELRAQLEGRGCVFQTQSDTEVLLHLYREFDVELLSKLRGMFAFAIWDQTKKRLFLARDPFGIKPLYYSDDGKQFKFASQVKALQQASNMDSTLSAAGQVGFYLLGYVPEPFTIYQNVHALPAGHYLLLQKDRSPSLHSFFDLRQTIINTEAKELSEKERLDVLHDAFLDSVERHFISDVPVGVFLSAGLDSSCLLGFAAQLKRQKLLGITLGFEEFKNTQRDEVPLAAQVARHFDAKQSLHTVRKQDFMQDYEQILMAMDQPSIDGVNVYFVSQAAQRANLKVAISGLGGDELMGGYPSFHQIPAVHRMLGWLPGLSNIGCGLRVITAPILKRMTSPKYAGLLEYGDSVEKLYFLRRGLFMPWELTSVLDPEIVRQGWKDFDLLTRLSAGLSEVSQDSLKVMLLEMTWYMRSQLLRDADWAGMHHSLEIRVPFVDVVLFKKLLPFIKSNKSLTKQDMVHALKTELPDAIVHRKKSGFGTPVTEWIKERNQQTTNERGLREWAKVIFKRISE